MTNRSVEIVTERPLSRILSEHLVGAVLSFLPDRWRRWWDSVPSDAVISGAIEAGVASYFFLHVMLISMDSEINGMDHRVLLGAAQTHGDTAIMALGPMVIIGLLLKPATLALAVTAVDGYVRAATALISQEVFPSMWLALPDKMISATVAWLNPPRRTPVRLFKDEN